MDGLFNDSSELFKKPKAFIEKVKHLFQPKQKWEGWVSPLVSPRRAEALEKQIAEKEKTKFEERFKKGFQSYGSKLATASADFARQAEENPLPDPFMPAVISLMETSGGRNQRFSFNPFNWGMQHFPSLPYAIERIYSGIGKRMPQYQDYRESGKLEDLFKHYTPPSGTNPSQEELVKRYNELRKLFD